ncbi:MAG: carbon storage regulator CsrA [Leptonema illini]|uniref:Translational regulator CsrA n=2 Tax=Leptonema illini TaxID=183 RepID=H2CGH6_9LEPT|nr:carbon storage regulator CsrA [Leptonema illini]EHQ07893.1 carbon storage regulator, CsrA [Leptonema illini DSM 21528]KAB2935309.1 MAG: carbon storage regulator CsrA [Leptonema illini]PKL30600.1 MAG: carbon storage regulator [Spirochaetae bacterium HGW-Spirochaetae-10]
MLILARKLNESIMIGDDVEIVVVEIKGDQVKLGIRAPRNVAVHRTEIYKEIRDQNTRAAETPAPESLDSLASLIKKKKPK